MIIGDENDNDMQDGESKIFVYKYKQNATFTIGRVYVNDPDDWDLPDKVFRWENEREPSHFKLDPDSGSIMMKDSTPSGEYSLRFKVTFSPFVSSFSPFPFSACLVAADERVGNFYSKSPRDDTVILGCFPLA